MYEFTLLLVLVRASRKFGVLYQNSNITDVTKKILSVEFKVLSIGHSTLMATCIKLLETGSEDVFWNRSYH